MLPTPVEIKEKLVKALDDNNDVDESAVMEMVSTLEKYPITRATLEETKIGKMVNDLRRKIKNERLAKRVKQLVRNWKKILDQTAPLNGSPGLVHPAITQLQSSPAISPALSPSPASGRLVSPAQVRSKSNMPTMGAQKSTSPALLGNKSGAIGGRKGISPAMMGTRPGTPSSGNRPGTPSGSRPGTPSAASAQKVASPALPGSRSRASLTTAAPSRLASPALSGRMVSPAVSGRVVSPAVSGRVVSPVVSGRTVTTPMASGRLVSPAVGHGTGQPSPLVATSPPIQSSALRSSVGVAEASGRHEDHGKPSTVRQSKGKGIHTTENGSGRVTPVSLHSENSQDRVLWETDNGKHDSDDGSSCSSSLAGQLRYPHNHSTSVSLTNSNKNYGKDQRELSKTNVANRKRTREKSNSPPDDTSKKSRLESSSLSVHSTRQEKVVNGCVSSKPSKKSLADIPRVSSTGSLPTAVHKHVSSPSLFLGATNEDRSFLLTHSQSESLFRQESNDSRLSAQSLDRPSRDKHKVKTTEQLIEDLQKKNNSSHVGNTIMTKLRTNQIEKERDMPGSALPVGVKPRVKRGRRGKNQDINFSVPSSSDSMLTQVKNELVERFLSTSDPSSAVDEYSPFKEEDILSDPVEPVLGPKMELGACSSSYSKDNFGSCFSASRQDRSESAPKDENSMDVPSPVFPSTSQSSERTGSALTLQEIYAQLPPINYDIDWDAVDFYELPEPKPVTDEVVNSLHNNPLPGINGMYDINQEWTSWKETMTLPSFEGNQLHILPYVDLDN